MLDGFLLILFVIHTSQYVLKLFNVRGFTS